jgi:murein DD-endopeptidase MepM/ murein hydrolase activator NlpD
VAAVPCMPSVCSEAIPATRRKPVPGGATPGVRPLVARLRIWVLLLLIAPLTPATAQVRSAWVRGVFPVASFAGYTSAFGMRTHPLSGDRRAHFGVDIAAPLGSAVRSWWSGTISEVIRDGGCGNGLTIRSGDYEHIYCHLAGEVNDGAYRSGAVRLAPGQRVRAGQVIGHIGVSGSSTGPHLHWGMRYRGRWMDPARVLRAMAASRGGPAPAAPRTPNVGVLR